MVFRRSKIQKKVMSDMIEMEADLTVGKKFLNQTYKSHVLYYKDKDKIIVSNIGGPLKHLQNEWEIREVNNQSEVSFKIDFEIKNIVYNMIMKKSFDQGLRKIADAFEKRAISYLRILKINSKDFLQLIFEYLIDLYF